MNQQEILRSQVIRTDYDTSSLGFSQVIKRLANHIAEQELCSIDIAKDEIKLSNADYQQEHKT